MYFGISCISVTYGATMRDDDGNNVGNDIMDKFDLAHAANMAIVSDLDGKSLKCNFVIAHVSSILMNNCVSMLSYMP